MFFGLGNRWHNWSPTNEYLSAVSQLDTITKLKSLMSKFVYKWDTLKILFWTVLWDNWQMPDQSLKDMFGDCEDAAILALDVLGRIQHREGARLIVTFGYYMTNNKPKLMGHVVTAFEDGKGGYNIFSNDAIEYGFIDFMAISRRFYPLGLKWQQVRNWEGKILNNRFKLFGVF